MHWDEIPGWTDEHIRGLYDWAIARAAEWDMTAPPPVFVELGVAFGRSLAYADEAMKRAGKHVRLVGVDAWELEDWMTRDNPNAQAMIQVAGSFYAAAQRYLSGTRAILVRLTSTQAAATVSVAYPEGIDFVFIDADHTYEGVLADLRAWWPLVRQGGAIAGHDHTDSFPGVAKACREFFGEGNYEIVGTCFRKLK